MGYLISALLIVMALIGSAWVQWDKRQHDPWLRLLDKIQQRLKSLGLATQANTPPRTLAMQVQAHFGASAQELVDYLVQLEQYRYAKKDDQSNQNLGNMGNLRSAFRKINWPAQQV